MANDIIRKQRIIDLRNKLNAELKRRGLSQQSFSNITENSTAVTTSDIESIRNGINSIKTHAYTDNTLEKNKTVIKDIHFSELENMVTTLSNQPKQGGTSDCNSSCTGMCISCTGDCGASCGRGCGHSCGRGCGTGCQGTNTGGYL